MILGFFIITFIGLTKADPMPLNYKYIELIEGTIDVHSFGLLNYCSRTINGDYSKFNYFNNTHAIRTYHKDMDCKGDIKEEKYYKVEYYIDESYMYNYEICTINYQNNECKNDPYAIDCIEKQGCNKIQEGYYYYMKYFPVNNSISFAQWQEPECQSYSPYNYINGKCYSGITIEYFGKNGTFPIFTILFIIVIHFLL